VNYPDPARFNHERQNDLQPCTVCGKPTKGEALIAGRWVPCCFLVHMIEDLVRTFNQRQQN